MNSKWLLIQLYHQNVTKTRFLFAFNKIYYVITYNVAINNGHRQSYDYFVGFKECPNKHKKKNNKKKILIAREMKKKAN